MCIYFFTGQNLDSIGITLIGNYENIAPTDQQLNALKKVINKDGIDGGKIGANYVLYVQNYFNPANISPGKKAIEILKTWPNYVKSYYLEEESYEY